jgi:hypothetical protein
MIKMSKNAFKLFFDLSLASLLNLKAPSKMPKFVRPATLKFPQIYGTFNAKDKDSDSQVEYIIQDLPEDYFEEALNLLVNVFLPDEALYSTRGVSADAAAIQEVRAFWSEKLAMKTSLACFRDGSKDLAGLYVLAVYSSGDAPFEVGF